MKPEMFFFANIREALQVINRADIHRPDRADDRKRRTALCAVFLNGGLKGVQFDFKIFIAGN